MIEMIMRLLGKQKAETFTPADMQDAYEAGIAEVLEALDADAYQGTRIGFTADLG